MRRIALTVVLILPLLLFVTSTAVYARSVQTDNGDVAADSTDAEILDELEKLLEDDSAVDGGSDGESDPLTDEQTDILQEVEDILLDSDKSESVDKTLRRNEYGEMVSTDKVFDINNYLKMISVKGGCFKMGDNFGDGHFDERPVHEVCIDDYSLSDTEVTQELYEEVMGFNPARNKGVKNPVDYTSWGDAGQFIITLNQISGRHFRLPTEAEWEFAARGGGKLEQWPGTNDEDDTIEYAWMDFNSSETTQPVKTKKPNLLGFYDMAGNVWEWVYDYYDMGYYKKSVRDNPEGPNFSIWRGLRGGSYIDEAGKLRTSGRYGSVFTRRASNIGFRIAE